MHNIFIIYTGGTIGMVKDETGTFVPFDFELIKRNLPDLSRLDYKLTVHSFEPIIDSSNMKPEIWIEMAQIIKDNYANYDGFVILHGSDTMAFTASVLSFMLEGLQKPVILSGSQLPIGEIRTDARENMMTALEIASAKQDGISKRYVFFSTINYSAAIAHLNIIRPNLRPLDRQTILYWSKLVFTSNTIQMLY